MSKQYFRAADGVAVTDTEALIDGRILRDGYRMTLNIAFMDSASARSMALRDSAGAPITLYDEQTGGLMKLTEDLITAIEAEAKKLGMSLVDYVQLVLKYSWPRTTLTALQNLNSPAERA